MRSFLGVVLLAGAWGVAARGGEDLRLPLTVHEAIRLGAKGLDRTSEPVKLGLPFTDEMAVKEKNGRPQLKVEGASVYQARTLARWPSGNVRWALLDFQSDCGAGKTNTRFKIVRGDGAGGGKPLAAEAGDLITVNTGAMRASIRKKGFNLFEEVVVGKEMIVSPGSPGVVLLGPDGTRYTASADTDIKVSLEENGPARCVVLARGTHRNGKKRMLDFTVRMHFYRGKTRARVFYTLRNASSKQVEYAKIKGLELVLKIKLGGAGKYRVAKHDGVAEGALPAGKELVYLQQTSSFPNVGRRAAAGGYTISAAGRQVAQGKAKDYPRIAWLDLAGPTGIGATASLRFAAAFWPSGIRASGDGLLAVSPWPVRKDKDHRIIFTSHNTREMLFDFHARVSLPEKVAYAFQYPLVAKGPVSWYNRCQNDLDIYPLYHFVARSEQDAYAKRRGWKNRMTKVSSRVRRWYYHSWGTGGFCNQHALDRMDLVDFLREDVRPDRAGERFLAAEMLVNYNADHSVPHNDGPGRIRKMPKPSGLKRKQHFEWEHRHWYGMPVYYYLTGDERIGETARFYAKLMKGSHRYEHCAKPTFYYLRVGGWAMYTLGAAYDFSDFKDEDYRKFIRANLQLVLSGKTPVKLEWSRGGMFGGPGKKYDRICQPGLMTGYILHDGLWNAARNLPDGDPLRERVEDVLEGQQRFIARECFYFNGDSGIKANAGRALWIPYFTNLDSTKPPGQHYCMPGMNGFSIAMPIERFGEEFRKDLAGTYVRACYEVGDSWSGYAHVSTPGFQALLWRLAHPRKDTTPPEPVKDLKAEALGGGAVRLSWSAPSGGALRYQVKHCNRKIVPNLNFNRETRKFEFAPDKYASWWAAENVQGEPAAKKSGERQSFTVKNIPAGKRFFAIRSWDAARNRSGNSNAVQVDVR